MRCLYSIISVCLGLSGVALAGSADHSGTRLPSVPGHFGNSRTSQEVLVVRDFIPWGGDVVPYFVDHGVGVTVIPAQDLRTANLSPYCLVYVTGAQTQVNDSTSIDLNSLASRNNLTAFLDLGGALCYVTASDGATLRLPGGVNSSPSVQSVNEFTDVNPLSAGMPFPEFEGGEASHDSLMNLPSGAFTYITDPAGGVTAADYALGDGRVLALTQPLEYYLGEGAGLFPHMVTLLENTVAYSLSIGQCDGQILPGELSLSMDAISAFQCVAENYDPLTGEIAITLINVGGSSCDDIAALLSAGEGLTIVGGDQQQIAQLLPGEAATFTFQVAPAGHPCDRFLHYDLLISCATCQLVSGSGQIWVPCCDVVDALDQPLAFQLKGNHPNPFNPVTTISYTLPATGEARLTVFRLTGEQVATLVEGIQEAGEHQVTFDAGHLGSGLYLYKLEAFGQTQAGRMMLIK